MDKFNSIFFSIQKLGDPVNKSKVVLSTVY